MRAQPEFWKVVRTARCGYLGPGEPTVLPGPFDAEAHRNVGCIVAFIAPQPGDIRPRPVLPKRELHELVVPGRQAVRQVVDAGADQQRILPLVFYWRGDPPGRVRKSLCSVASYLLALVACRCIIYR